MLTIDDVARRAGVSRMTVSRAINSSGYIRKETRERILQAIEELKYRPNLVAKTLITHRSHTMAYVMVNISDPFHNMVSQGLESVAFKGRYTAMVCDAHSPSREKDYVHMFLDHRIGGVIFHHLAITSAQAAELKDYGVQCVMMDNEEPIEGIPAINTDNRAGGRMAVEYLASRGHTRIACLHGSLTRPEGEGVPYEDTFQFGIWRERTEGFIETMRSMNLVPAGLYLSNGRFELAAALAPGILDSILDMSPRPTAMYCENDMMAVAMLNELQARGVRIPRDMAVIGHDGLDICRMLHPYITTVAQPRYEMGRQAALALIRCIETACAPETVVLQPSLMPGETA